MTKCELANSNCPIRPFHDHSQSVAALPKKQSSDIAIEQFTGPLTILYQDDSLIAVDKPAGLLVHRANQVRESEPVLLQSIAIK